MITVFISHRIARPGHERMQFLKEVHRQVKKQNSEAGLILEHIVWSQFVVCMWVSFGQAGKEDAVEQADSLKRKGTRKNSRPRTTWRPKSTWKAAPFVIFEFLCLIMTHLEKQVSCAYATKDSLIL